MICERINFSSDNNTDESFPKGRNSFNIRFPFRDDASRDSKNRHYRQCLWSIRPCRFATPRFPANQASDWRAFFLRVSECCLNRSRRAFTREEEKDSARNGTSLLLRIRCDKLSQLIPELFDDHGEWSECRECLFRAALTILLKYANIFLFGYGSCIKLIRVW